MLPINTLLQERYRSIEHIGRGGMGAVHKAEDLRLNMTVAVKPTLVESEQLSKAFHRDAQLLAYFLMIPILYNIVIPLRADSL
jgi:serine/threonine protein kinase